MSSISTARVLPQSILPDEEVARRVIAGEIELFEVIMRRYNQRLFRVAQSILDDEGEAEDVLQETYVRAYSRLDSFRGQAQFSTWLTKIAVYEALRRRKKRRRFVGLPLETAPNLPPSPQPSPERETGNLELRQALERAIQGLPSHYRVVFVLRELEGLSNQETAASLGLGLSAAKVRLHRARKMLQEKVGPNYGPEVQRLYAFHLSRCDRVVEAVISRLA